MVTPLLWREGKGSGERTTDSLLKGNQRCFPLLYIIHQFPPHSHVSLVFGMLVSCVWFSSLCCQSLIMRYLQLQFDCLHPLVKVRMFADILLVSKPEIVAFWMIIRGFSLMLKHVPGLRREGTIYPGSLNIVDQNNSKFGLTIIKFLRQNVQVSDSLC